MQEEGDADIAGPERVARLRALDLLERVDRERAGAVEPTGVAGAGMQCEEGAAVSGRYINKLRIPGKSFNKLMCGILISLRYYTSVVNA